MGLLDALGIVFGGVSSAFKAVRAALAQLANAIAAIAGAISRALGAIWRHLSGAQVQQHEFDRLSWTGGIRNFIPNLLDFLDRVKARLLKVFAPVIRIIKRIEAMQDAQIRMLRPLFNAIQRMRQALVLFRLLHLKFAERLDAQLAGIEAKIAAPILLIRQELNRVLGYINLIVDPTGLFDARVYLLSALRSVRELINLIDNVRTRALFASEQGFVDEMVSVEIGLGLRFNFAGSGDGGVDIDRSVGGLCDQLLEGLINEAPMPKTALEKKLDDLCDKLVAELVS